MVNDVLQSYERSGMNNEYLRRIGHDLKHTYECEHLQIITVNNKNHYRQSLLFAISSIYLYIIKDTILYKAIKNEKKF